MRNSGGAAIHMRPVLDKITYLVGNEAFLRHMGELSARTPFSEELLRFFECLSRKLLSDPAVKKYPDVAAYAFWVRRASLELAAKRYANPNRIGRGVVFQIAPSNIPVQFAVSMTYALLAGNASVVRVSGKPFEQVRIICEMVSSVLEEHFPGLAPYVLVIRYDHDDAVTQALSNLCDVRMIWGGNHTISAIQRIPLWPGCLDIGFADRYSIAVIDAGACLNGDLNILVNDFYIDTYYTDQNACSSTRLIVWIGDRIAEAKEAFWSTMAKTVSQKYTMNAISGSEKLLRVAVLAAKYPEIREIKENNLLVRVELPELYPDCMEYKGNSGFFFEYNAADLSEIVPLLRRACQTITYVGELDGPLRTLVSSGGVRGVDRIVPMGHSMDLSFIWDGYVLPEVLSRYISDI